MRAAASAFLVTSLIGFAGSLPNDVSLDEALCPTALSAKIPVRSQDAPGGTEFMRSIWGLRGLERDQAILAELGRGNMPEFMRRLKPVRMFIDTEHDGRHEAVICVTPDYLAIGSDDDYVRVPMGFRAAATVARDFEFILPTRKMVDAIYAQSDIRLEPQPMQPGPQMVSTEYFSSHNATIERQLSGNEPGELVAGHKKDIILTKRLITRRGRVAIYGWHQRRGKPIQPLSTVHGARYADYSHGVRLVSTTVLYDGVPRRVYDLLQDRKLASVITHEGTIKDAARIMGLPGPSTTTND